MQETKASLQVLTRSSRNEPCNTSESTCHSINQEGLEELRNEPVTIDPLPLPGRAGPGVFSRCWRCTSLSNALSTASVSNGVERLDSVLLDASSAGSSCLRSA